MNSDKLGALNDLKVISVAFHTILAFEMRLHVVDSLVVLKMG